MASHSISSPEHRKLLNVIDQIRSQGISRYIDIPQIVVCGDQSSGKSSCLEAICGRRFPTGDGLCTRFATEYILRRTPDASVSVSIVADADRSDNDKTRIQGFKPSTLDLDNFPLIIHEAAAAMGIGQNSKTFAKDVLRIEICGPGNEHLTLVDLPGLFHSSNKTQTDDDKDAVFSLVGSYIERPRSIILAVVSAKNDLQNQTVLNFARKHDENGNRTLGIITKPDTLSKSSPSESSYYELAKNNDVKFALGWHVIKNRSFEELSKTKEERDKAEEYFLGQGVWRNLDAKSKGIDTLRSRLSKILQNHILNELPSLLKDMETGIADCQIKLDTLGASRGTPDEQRQYLLNASAKFVSLISSAVQGNYTTDSAYFGSSLTDSGYEKRLCAVVQNILDNYKDKMRKNGHTVQLVEAMPKQYDHFKGIPKMITKEGFYNKVQGRMSRNRGKELSGMFNPAIVGDLFKDQAEPWQRIAASTTDALIDATHTAVGLALGYAADETTIDGILAQIINPAMEPLESALTQKVDEILMPHLKGRVSTFNHYFTDNLQKMREDESSKTVTKQLHEFLGINADIDDANYRRYEGNFDVRHLRDVLIKQTERDMGRFAAIEATNGMLAYYKVALKNVVDAISSYAIDMVLLEYLPEIFTPQKVWKLTPEEVQIIAGESPDSLEQRETLTKKLAVLKDTQKILLRLDRHKSAGSCLHLLLDEISTHISVDSSQPKEGNSGSLTNISQPKKHNSGTLMNTWQSEKSSPGSLTNLPSPEHDWAKFFAECDHLLVPFSEMEESDCLSPLWKETYRQKPRLLEIHCFYLKLIRSSCTEKILSVSIACDYDNSELPNLGRDCSNPDFPPYQTAEFLWIMIIFLSELTHVLPRDSPELVEAVRILRLLLVLDNPDASFAEGRKFWMRLVDDSPSTDIEQQKHHNFIKFLVETIEHRGQLERYEKTQRFRGSDPDLIWPSNKQRKKRDRGLARFGLMIRDVPGSKVESDGGG